MRIPFSTLRGWQVAGPDGDVGPVADLVFDDRTWSARFLVVETARWLCSRRVLLSTERVRRIDRSRGLVEVDLGARELDDAPGVETAPPVSRQRRIAYLDDLHALLPWGARPGVSPLATQGERAPDDAGPRDARHRRSVAEVRGYGVRGADGRLAGVAVDVLADAEDWTLPRLVIQTRLRPRTSRVSLRSGRVRRIDLEDRLLEVDLTARGVERCTAYPEPSRR